MIPFFPLLLAFLPAPSLSTQLNKGVLGELKSCSGMDGHGKIMPQSFENFIQKFGRTYKQGTKEYERRFKIFAQRVTLIQRQNCKGKRTWKATVNSFADRTDDERSRLLGWRRGAMPRASFSPQGTQLLSGHVNQNLLSVGAERLKSGGEVDVEKIVRTDDDMDLPASFNWRNLSAMNHVRDQGDCGSCWAQSAVTVLSAHAEIAGRDHDFSVQQIVSCTSNPHKCGGSGGCEGATTELAFDYVLENGLKGEESMPYLASDVQCPSDSVDTSGSTVSAVLNAMRRVTGTSTGGAAIGMKGWVTLPENKMLPLKQALVTLGPVGVSVAADAYWFIYSSGVMTTCNTDKPIVNHAVVLVGYGVDQNQDGEAYWELQNSWGVNWGERGFIRIANHGWAEETTCGIDDQPEVGVACMDNLPQNVTVCGSCGILYNSVVPYFTKIDTPTVASFARATLSSAYSAAQELMTNDARSNLTSNTTFDSARVELAEAIRRGRIDANRI